MEQDGHVPAWKRLERQNFRLKTGS